MKPNTVSKRNRTKTNKKKASAHKLRVIQNVKNILNSITICNIFIPDDDEGGNSLVFHGACPIKVSPSLSWNLENICAHWELTCGVFYRDQQGKHFIEYVTIQSIRETLANEISIHAQKVCAWLFHNGHKMTKLCPFWLAVPRSNNKNVDLTLAYRTAHAHKVFNRLGTNFEINCNLPIVDYHQGAWFDIPKDWEKTKEIDINLEEILKINLVEKQTENGTEVEIEYPSE